MKSASSSSSPTDASRMAIVDREAEWFAQARRGDRAAFGRLVQALQDRLYNAVHRMVRRPEDAMDVTQETFAKALASIGECRGDSKPYTWLFRIAMNCAISRQRKETVRQATSIDASSSNDSDGAALRDRLGGRGPTPVESAVRNERVEQVRLALGRL